MKYKTDEINKPMILKMDNTLRLKQWIQINREFNKIHFILPRKSILPYLFFKPFLKEFPAIPVTQNFIYDSPERMDKFFIRYNPDNDIPFNDDEFLYMFFDTNINYESSLKDEIEIEHLSANAHFAQGHILMPITPANTLSAITINTTYLKHSFLEVVNAMFFIKNNGGTILPGLGVVQFGSSTAYYYLCSNYPNPASNKTYLRSNADSAQILVKISNPSSNVGNIDHAACSIQYRLIGKKENESPFRI